ncbi:hypothetical protein A2V71_01240 [Candidatus Berkelbacteria bacterium RBG_13_40_8]|uniref:Uncharacterized protein n=1 Tax=Candidatus Berkelbacteria bacterium RBG_13_40_8 TaxID=1797467 RepID=A0A1F5DMG2_9BACT|nr:MAG: hypothetical protein A2V71_01240 [Candidatus Berkelbacteria bacterium RBG_13_40_8]
MKMDCMCPLVIPARQAINARSSYCNQNLKIKAGIAPFPASHKKQMVPGISPNSRQTLVAPMFPEPRVLMSMCPHNFPITNPEGNEPKM